MDNQDTIQKIAEWLIDGDTGQSSLSLASVYLGGREFNKHNLLTPSDTGDFKRCRIFLSIIPKEERKPLIDKMAEYSLHWKVARDNWDELEELYKDAQKTANGAPLFERMKAIGL